jgi:CMP-N-acetylneuraminic acid synthetase
MFDVVIPIRSGSKEIKNKNIKKFNRDNLTNLLLKKIINLKDINRIFILTDSTDYKKKIIKHKKINTEYIRLKKHSADNSIIYDLVNHFFKWLDIKKYKTEKILLLQVTSPLLHKNEISKTISFIKQKKISSLFHVSEMIEHPYECIKGFKKKWSPIIKNNKVNRQNFDSFYFITGSLWFFTKKFFLKYKKFYNKKSYAYKIDKINFVDIDTMFDFEIAKKLTNLKIRN